MNRTVFQVLIVAKVSANKKKQAMAEKSTRTIVINLNKKDICRIKVKTLCSSLRHPILVVLPFERKLFLIFTLKKKTD